MSVISVLILTVGLSAAQAPVPDDLDEAMSELRRVIAETKAELKHLRREEKQRQAAQIASRLRVKPEDQRRLILRLAVERDLLEEKVKKNNRTFRCRVLHIGCIKIEGVKIR